MAVRLSADLGLHLDLSSSDLQGGTLSDRELDVRRTTFWGVFVHDKSVPPEAVNGQQKALLFTVVCGAYMSDALGH